MTLYLKKSKNFERQKFFDDFESNVFHDQLYRVVDADDEIDDDVCSELEAYGRKGFSAS